MIAAEKTYWDIVKAQFAKNRLAVWALRLLATLFLLAIAAPILCTSSPFYLSLPEGSPWKAPRFPWLTDLFDHNCFPSGVDLFFNLLLVLLVPGLLLWRFTRGAETPRLPRGRRRALPRDVSRDSPPPRPPLNYSKPKITYRAIRAPELQLVLADVKLKTFRRKLEEARGALGAAEARLAEPGLAPAARSNADADRLASADRVETAEREIRTWEERRLAALKLKEDKTLACTMILPPVGYHHSDNDERSRRRAADARGRLGNLAPPRHRLATGRDVFALHPVRDARLADDRRRRGRRSTARSGRSSAR